jgi:hypothetical protein
MCAGTNFFKVKDSIAQIERTIATRGNFLKVKYLKNQAFAYTSCEIVVSLRAFLWRFGNFLK